MDEMPSGIKRGRPAAPPKGKAPSAQQTQLERLPLLNKPLELVGEQIKVRGQHGDGQIAPAA